MHLWPFYIGGGQKPAIAKRIVALVALVCCLPILPVAAEETAPIIEKSSFFAKGYAAPEVPLGERVSDDYFFGAVMIGDSLAVGMDSNYVVPKMSYIAKVGISARAAAFHRTYPKSRGSDSKVYLTDLLEQVNPLIIYIWLGDNGVDNAQASVILQDYRELLNVLIGQYPDALIYVMELLPVGTKAKDRYKMLTNENIDAFNAGLWELAEQHQVYVLPINALLREEDGTLSREHGTGDGIHLRSTGYEVIAEYLYTHTIPVEGR